LWHIKRNAGTDDDQILVAKCALAVVSGLDTDSAVEQQRNLLRELLFRLGVGDGDARSQLFQKRPRHRIKGHPRALAAGNFLQTRHHVLFHTFLQAYQFIR
jgi:hypothetical protein